MNKFLVGGVVVAVILGVLGLFKGEKVTTVIQEKDGTTVGAISPYIPTPEINLGGLRLVGKEIALATGTSTVCAIQAPSATSTLISAGVKFTLASTSAVITELAKNPTQYSTTTKIGSTYGVGASKPATIVASSTGSVAGDATIFEPNYWFTARIGDVASYGSSGVGYASTGRCWAVWAVPQ